VPLCGLGLGYGLLICDCPAVQLAAGMTTARKSST
jgi:hypothetical protein